MSTILTAREIKSLCKIGDIMVPGTDDFPSFTETGCIQYVDDILKYLSADDLSGIKLLLKIFSFFPGFILRVILKIVTAHHDRVPSFIGTILRQINLGLKGIVMSLYYSNKTSTGFSGPTPFDVIGYKITVIK